MASNEQQTQYTLQPEVGTAAAPISPVLLLVAGLLLPGLLAYTLVTTNETQVVAVVLGVLGLLVILARPFWGFIFFVGPLYTRPEESFPPSRDAPHPVSVSGHPPWLVAAFQSPSCAGGPNAF